MTVARARTIAAFLRASTLCAQKQSTGQFFSARGYTVEIRCGRGHTTELTLVGLPVKLWSNTEEREFLSSIESLGH